MKWAPALAVGLAALLLGPSSALAAPCDPTFANAITGATNGSVVTAPPGICQVNITTTNTSTFTIQADPSGSTLEPATANSPILKDTAGPHFTITGITFTGMNGAPALSTDGGDITLIGDVFSDNAGGTSLGAAQLLAPSSVTIQNSTFSGNSDGAVFIGANPAITIRGSTFSSNRASYAGGALDISNGSGSGSSPIVIDGNVFDGNSAGAAGGAASVSASHAQPVTITGNTFTGNQISGSATNDRVGGGLVLAAHADDSGFQAQQSGNRFMDNSITATQASGHTGLAAGGAGEWVSGAVVHSTGDVFQGNSIAVNDGAPPEGGGLGVLALPPLGTGQPANPGVFTGVNDLFLGNTVAAGGWGGAIYIGSPVYFCPTTCPASSLTLNDATVTGNSVTSGAGSEGGALWGSPNDSLSVANSIVSGNSAGAGQPDIFGFGAPNIQFTDVCTAPGSGAPLAGAGNICADPKLAADGAETVASPTIDAGANALVPAGLTTDLAGGPRFVVGHPGCSGPVTAEVDMGAFEAPTGPLPPCVPPLPPRISGVHVSSSGVTFLFTCGAGPCRGVASLRAIERRRGHRILALLSRHRTRVRKVSVLVGRRRFTVAAGARLRVKVPLNHTGKALLKRFHRLPVRLSISVTLPGGAKVTIGPRHLKIKAPRHKRRRHH
jgi:parallel beta helix pectate lyase-like protein